jgi:chemotaxis protein MotB
MARKRKHEEHENHERWLISYADFITLLFAFFVVMYSVSSVNEGKYRVLSESMTAAFHAPAKSMQPIQIGVLAKSPLKDSIPAKQQPTPITPPSMPIPKPLQTVQGQGKTGSGGAGQDKAQVERVLKTIAKEIEQAMSDLIDAGLVTVRRSAHAVEVEINTNVLFPSGGATLSAPARAVVTELADVLRKFPHTIHVEGFTDNVPISNSVFPSNWELSAGRAASVVHLFADAGIRPERMVAIGYGPYRPVADNATAEGRTRNRRVILVIQATTGAEALAGALSDYRGSAGPGAAPTMVGTGMVPVGGGASVVGAGVVDAEPLDEGRARKRPARAVRVVDSPIISPFAGGVIPGVGQGATDHLPKPTGGRP